MMTSRERVLAAFELKETDKIPYIDWFDPGIRKEIARKLDGHDEMNDAKFAQLIGMDAICISEYVPPFFCETIKDSEGVEHIQGEGRIKTDEDLKKMIFPDPKNDGFYDPAKRFVDQYGKEDLALFAGFRTGMLNTMFSMGMMGFSMALFNNRKLLETVFDRYSEWTAIVLEKLQTIGFDFLMSYDDIAFNSGPMFSPDTFNEFFLPRLKELVKVIKVPWAFHSDGDMTKVMDGLVSLGMHAVNSFQPDVMDIKEMKDKYGDKVCVWGNIDLHHTLTRGTTEEVEAEVKQRIEECGPGGGYIISSANSITDYCKVENAIAMIETIRKYRSYPISID